MPHSSNPAESFAPKEAPVSNSEHQAATIAADVYNSKDSAYTTVFPKTASNDKLKTDAQLNAELSNMTWDPYESLTLNLSDRSNVGYQPSPKNDNAIVVESKSAAGANAWDPYESLTLNLSPRSTDK